MLCIGFQNDLAKNRKTLSELLLTLLQEQRQRQRHLINNLQQLEVDQEVCIDTLIYRPLVDVYYYSATQEHYVWYIVE